ncbi:hypothetical protein [Nesterenkonia populi]
MTLVITESDEQRFSIRSGGFGLTGRALTFTQRDSGVEVFVGRRLWGTRPIGGDNPGSMAAVELTRDEARELRDWLNEHL